MDSPVWCRKAKRVADVLLAGLGLVLLAPVLAAVAAVSLVVLGRPVLFRQVRPGWKERPFEIVKFRTMRPPEPGETWFRTDAARLTRWGRFLRKVSIDELPELWNVLKGEMSLVGPRPLLSEYLSKYTPEEKRRHDVRPGITGWAQVNGRQSIRFSERIRLDVWYVDNWSLTLDARILAKTVLRLANADGALPGQDVSDVDDLGLSADRERADEGEDG